MNRQEIYKKITAILLENFDDPDILIFEHTTAKDIEKWDSINHITIMISIEIEFQIKFTGYEIENVNNVGELIDLISTKSYS